MGLLSATALAACSALAGSSEQGKGGGVPPSPDQAQKKLNRSLSRFIENRGQWDPAAQFLARSKNLDVWITKDGVTYDYYRTVKTDDGTKADGHVVKMSFVGGRFGSGKGADEKRITTDFLRGRNPKVTAKSYGEVYVNSVYPGIDLRNYFENGSVRYDFLLAPGADPKQIKLGFSGADSVQVANSEIVLSTKLGALKQGRLVAYQVVNGKRTPVKAAFELAGKNLVAIKLGAYDHSKALVIDPLVYGSYYGGDNGMDAVTAITTDNAGGVYMTGWTFASQFPSIQGPYGFNVRSQDSFVTKLQGDAYSHDYAAYLGGTNRDFAQYIKLDPSGNVWVLGRTDSCDFPNQFVRANVQFLRVATGGATGGTFQLRYGNFTTTPLAWNATPAQVQAAINALPGFAGLVSVTLFRGANLPASNAVYRIELDCSLPGQFTVINNRTVDPFSGAEINEGLPNIYVVEPYPLRAPTETTQWIRHRGSNPAPVPPGPASSWTITYNNGTQAATSAALPAAITAAALQGVLQGLAPSTGNTWQLSGGALPGAPIILNLLAGNPPNNPPAQVFLDGTLSINNTNMWPKPAYEVVRFTDVFITEFKQDATGILNPLPTHTLMFGDEYATESPAGFGIIPRTNPVPSDTIELLFTGDTNDTASQVPGPQQGNSYLMRYTYDPNLGTFTVNNAASRWLSTLATQMGGLDVDPEGSVYIAGTAIYNANADTSVNPLFVTTPGVFEGGRLLRRRDIFIRKYDASGALVYSALIGGNNDDAVGGHLYRTQTGGDDYLGSAIAVDKNLNAYVTGISQSFNFPRTRGVFGEVFDNNPNVTVTKVNSDCSQIVYSTNLRTIGFVNPSGIAVDTSGNAFISGNIGIPGLLFPEDNGQPSGDPNYPQSIVGATNNTPLGSSIQTTPDALDPVWDSPTPNRLPTSEGWINVLNNTGTTLVYGSYIGGFLDEEVYGPYVDSFGDVWISGWTDSTRVYTPPFVLNNPGPFVDTGGLPASLISPLAFKSSGDANGSTGIGGVLYGLLSPNYPFVQPFSLTIGITVNRDGFIIKKRVFLPTVQTVVMNPPNVPGGLGASTTGTITLSQAAPTGGADVSVTLNNTTAASFDPNTALGTIVVTIPQGQTTGTFTVFTNPVTSNTQVQAKAVYQGSFQIAQFTVVPWLQQLALTPTSIVGGNSVLGRVTLAAPAPTGGVEVDLLTDTPTLVSFPGGSTFTVPEGQTSANFVINTEGVATQTDVAITTSLLGVGKTQTLTIRQASVATVTFNPNRVAGGTDSTGTVTLDGKAGSTFTVNLALDAGTPGYTLTPSTLTFNAGDTQKTFTVHTVYEAANTQRKVTATRPAQGTYAASSAQGTLFIDAVNLTGLSLNPSSVPSGQSSTGTVTIGSPAPLGGVIVNLSSGNPSVAQVPASVTVPAGASQVNFQVTTTVVGANTPVVISATRGPITKTATLNALGVTVGLSINPTSVIGGTQNATGTVTLGAAAPAGGLTVSLSSNDASASVPASVLVNAGATTAQFQITTSAVPTNRNVTITAQIGSNTATASLQVRANGVASISFSPSVVKGLQTTTMTVTLEAPAPVGGASVAINRGSNPQIANIPLTVTVLQGQTTAVLTITTRRVSRTLATQVTASYNGKSGSTLLTVTR